MSPLEWILIVAFILFIVLFLGIQILDSLDFEHNLYQFGTPGVVYSDMNGYGHFLQPLHAYTLYWTFFCVLLLAVAHLFYRRGYYDRLSDRFAAARQRWSGSVAASMLVALAGFAGVGSWIFYNTNVLNEYVTSDEREERQADYEKLYKHFEKVALPQLDSMDVVVDIYPDERRIESRGSAEFVNTLDVAIPEMALSLNRPLDINELVLEGAERVLEDELHHQYNYRFDVPMQPGERRALCEGRRGSPGGGGT